MNNFRKIVFQTCNYWIGFLLFSVYSFLSLRNGLSLSPDSCHYLASAESWKMHGEFLDAFGNPNLLWPPLYSILIAIVGLKEKYLLVINYSSLLFSIFIWIKLFESKVPSRFFQIVFTVLVASSTSFILCEKYIWSESFFILLVSLYIFFLIKLTESSLNIHWVLLTLVGSMMPLQRVAGLYVLIFLWIGIALVYRRTRKQNRKLFFLHVIVVILPFLLWFSEGFGGLNVREEAQFDLIFLRNIIHDFSDVTSRYFIPTSSSLPYLFLFLPFLLLGLTVLLFYSKDKRIRVFVFVYLGYILSYVVTIFLKKAGAGSQEVERFLAPLYPIFCFILCFQMNMFYLKLKVKWQRKTLAILLCIWLIYPIARVSKNSWNYGQLPKYSGVTIPCDYLNK
ncbi:hypothetical protein [Flammeovirga sp. OC4]|uniref:hypothetical protein n=1 Tax=Flammeovirga sp. OC4 TaxID=1382345 RepID=UPI0005C47596|nr:hypothetical protein [Flammeovirga sp. OC4]